MKMRIKKTSKYAKSAPRYSSEEAAGMDLYATESAFLMPGAEKIIDAGWAFEIPKGHFGLMGPRSGLAVKRGIIVKNAPAIIDSDFRGSLQICLKNIGEYSYTVDEGERIAQMAIVPFVQVEIEETEEDLSETSRGEGGYGSTGR